MQNFKLMTNTRDYEFSGVRLGYATSQAQSHTHEGAFVPSRVRSLKCSACRWQETTIYRTRDDKLVAFTVGRSIVPDEVDRARIHITGSAFELIELLTVRSGAEPFLPLPSALALAQAAADDDDIREAYVNRAVVR